MTPGEPFSLADGKRVYFSECMASFKCILVRRFSSMMLWIRLYMSFQNCNIPSTVLFYLGLFCFASFGLRKSSNLLISISVWCQCPLQGISPFLRTKPFLGQWWWLVTTWNGKGKSRGQMDEKQLETIVESYRHESMRNESKNMTKVWHPIPQNTPEVLNCVCLGSSIPKQNVFYCFSLSRRKDYHTYTWTEWKQWQLSVKMDISLSKD